MENLAWLSRVAGLFFYPGVSFKSQQQLQICSSSFKKKLWIIFWIFSRASNIAYLLDWAQMSDLDFGLIQQNIFIKKASFQY
jgi:hypothetical protein